MTAVTIPAPVGGWNAKDAYSAMPPTDAVRMVNWVPRAGYAQTRGGFTVNATGLGGKVATLVAYYGASETMIAGANGNLWNTNSGSPVSLGSGFASDWWQVANHSKKLVFVNGSDAPQVYDGTSLTAANFTGSPGGFVAADMWGINSFKGRMFYWAEGAQSFWYAAAASYQGALAEFDMQSQLQTGGSLVQMVTWTLDSGSGVDDLAVFIFSTGETLVYSGSDPGSATDWNLIGRFQIGEPLGPRAHCKVGGTEIILTSDGYVDIAAALKDGRYSEGSTYSSKIIRASKSAASLYKAFDGWQAVLYPSGQMFIVNVPTGASTALQHVRETSSGGWCEFEGWNALTFCVFKGRLYFGDPDGHVCLADDGPSDNGDYIRHFCIPAYNALGSRAMKKQLTACSVSSTALRPDAYAYDGLADFAQTLRGTLVDDVSVGGTLWDTSDWDTSDWASDDTSAATITNGWRNCAANGYAVTAAVRISQKSQTINWHSITYQYRKAGVF